MFRCLALRRVEPRQLRLFQFKFKLAQVRDFLRIGDRFRKILEFVSHLSRAFHRKIFVFHCQTARVINVGPGIDQHQDILGFGIGGVQIVAVVGGDQSDPGFFGDLDQSGVYRVLLGYMLVILQFEVKIALAEKLLVAQGCCFRFFHFF